MPRGAVRCYGCGSKLMRGKLHNERQGTMQGSDPEKQRKIDRLGPIGEPPSRIQAESSFRLMHGPHAAPTVCGASLTNLLGLVWTSCIELVMISNHGKECLRRRKKNMLSLKSATGHIPCDLRSFAAKERENKTGSGRHQPLFGSSQLSLESLGFLKRQTWRQNEPAHVLPMSSWVETSATE